MEIKLIELLFSVAATLLGAIAIAILQHIVKKIDRANNRQRLTTYKIDALVETLSPEFGNGEFGKRFERNIQRKMDEDDFIYKDI